MTDNIDAVYPNSAVQSESYAELISASLPTGQLQNDSHTNGGRVVLRPWLAGRTANDEQSANALVAQFFGHLSIKVFEDLYSLQRVDEKACEEDLIMDIFNETP